MFRVNRAWNCLHIVRTVYGHYFIWQLPVVTSCRLLYRINVFYWAIISRTAEWQQEGSTDSCQKNNDPVRVGWPVPVAARSEASICWDCGFESRAGHYQSVFSVVCCQVEVSATGWSLVRRSLTECGVSECDLENLDSEERPGPARAE